MVLIERSGPRALDYNIDLDHLPSRGFRAIKFKGLDCSKFWPYRETLRIEIVILDFDKLCHDPKSHFEALSYVWGVSGPQPPLPSQRVIVDTKNGERVASVYTNLSLALTSIWKNKVSSLPDRASCLPLFADGICINQDNEDEKIAQVKLMGKIYSQCSGVIVWLGPASTGSNAFFGFADMLCRRQDGVVCETSDLHPDQRVLVHDAVAERCRNADSLLRQTEGPDSGVEHGLHAGGVHLEQVQRLTSVTIQDCPCFPLAAYADVLRRPWFSRLWVIQEAALAPNGLFLCGNNKLSFDFFRATFFFYCLCSRTWAYLERRRETPMSELVLRDNIFEFARPYIQIGKERAAIQMSNREFSLATLVKKYNVNGDNKKIGASQPKDRIFGLLGLVGDPDMFNDLNYETGAKAYISFAEREAKRDVDILLFAQRKSNADSTAYQPDKSLESLPSWVPDWSISQMKIPHGYSSLTEKPRYAAGGGLRDEPATIDGSTLRIRGIVIDRITKVGEKQIRCDADNFLDFAALKHFFDEIDSLLVEAAAVRGSQPEDEGNSRLQTALCLTDGGLSPRKPASPEDPSLEELYDQLRKVGELNVRAEDAKNTYTSFSRTWERHSPVAWSWVSVFPPLAILRYILMPLDIILVLLVVAWMRLYLIVLAFRQSRTVVPVKDRRERIGGINLQLSRHWSMTEYKGNIARNRGRRLYMTQGVLIGLGPEDMHVGDIVVIFFGGSVPFIIREKGHSKGAKSATLETVGTLPNCQLVGEAYCPGVMEGEALAGRDDGDSTTFLIS